MPDRLEPIRTKKNRYDTKRTEKNPKRTEKNRKTPKGSETENLTILFTENLFVYRETFFIII